tara:strand:- start:3455 stop:3949 length:495 start_codon:yes stop_codon:yes gene_type:complete
MIGMYFATIVCSGSSIENALERTMSYISRMVAMFFVSMLMTTNANAETVIRKSGSIFLTISERGDIRKNGSLIGRVEDNGSVRKNGSLIGSVDNNGRLRQSGTLIGEIQENGNLRKKGTLIGQIDSSGTIRKKGSLWGSASNCCTGDERRSLAAVLVFFGDLFE